MPPSSIIPLHNHPGMIVLSKLLYGSLLVKSYDWLDIPGFNDPSQELASGWKKLASDYLPNVTITSMSTIPANVAIITSTKVSSLFYILPVVATFILSKRLTPCALFDVLSPPYSSEDGRHCSYFRRTLKQELPGTEDLCGIEPSEIAWLEETQPPENFAVQRGSVQRPCY
ncbi:hypothetical protein OIU78_024778 [Salix suchowensis]|nr:hypothetical protein OIU78_024778 [Salix suchowensis]